METLKELFTQLNSSINGLTEEEAKKRLTTYGYNKITAKKKKPLWLAFAEEFKDIMVIILIIAAIISGIAKEVTDTIIILIVVFLNACIGFIQKYKAEKALEALQKLVSPVSRIIRNGEQKQIPAEQIVPGDILILNEGDKITADAKIIEQNDLRVSEAILTGESEPISKLSVLEITNSKTQKNLDKLYMGTLVNHGTGKAIVIATGMRTEFGKIAELTTSTQKDKTPLEKQIHKIGLFVGKITLFLIIILFIIGYLIEGKNIIENLLFSASVAVAAVPEGLPATITIALALGVQKLAKKNAIVKQLASVETLGSTTVICSDKTGTLTKNVMTVKEMEILDGEMQINKISEQTALIASLCNNAKLINENKTFTCLGDPTEGALLSMTENSGFNTGKIREEHSKIAELPFDSDRKTMTSIYKNKNNEIFAYVKGAPEQLVGKCSQYLDHEGKILDMTEKDKKEILEKNNKMAEKALRVLTLSYKKLSKKSGKYTHDEIEKNLIFVGLVGIIDPPREEVKEAVALTKKAGIKIYIITGDQGLTAKAIAKELGIITSEKAKIVTGDELEPLTENELIQYFKKYPEMVFARISPAHKLKIVTALKEMGEVVAVTGDGVNDAPALKKADIGVAMGIIGTDVSKEAANMILADDSFSTIVTAIKEGRTIYENLKKFIFYIFSSNIGELVTIFASIFLLLPSPLTAILLLCINLGTDVFPALALSVEPAESKIMEQKPRHPDAKIMDKAFISRFFTIGIFIGVIVILTYLYTLYKYGWQSGMAINKESIAYLKASTMAFALLTFIQMANAYNSRSEKLSIFKIKFFSNLWLTGAVGMSIFILFLMVEAPFMQNLLKTTHLTTSEWISIVGMSLIIIFIEEIRKKLAYTK